MPARAPWFEVLGVSPDASSVEIRDRYLSLVKRWHPDRFVSDSTGRHEAEERVKAINAAYDEARAEVAERVNGDIVNPSWNDWRPPNESSLHLLFSTSTRRSIAFVLLIIMFLLTLTQTVGTIVHAVRP